MGLVIHVKAGESITIGAIKCTLTKIKGSTVILNFDGDKNVPIRREGNKKLDPLP